LLGSVTRVNENVLIQGENDSIVESSLSVTIEVSVVERGTGRLLIGRDTDEDGVPDAPIVLTAIAVVTNKGLASMYNPGAHGFSEALYAYDSQSNNNGSAFAGYGATEFSTLLGSLALWMGRFAPLVAALALGGALAAKKTVPPSAGTFRTDGATFAVLLVGVVILTAGLMIFPALTLGPIVEALSP
jgi:K+-transporting ATPase ATPase A chain